MVSSRYQSTAISRQLELAGQEIAPQFPLWVNCAILTVRRSLPAPDEQTFSKSAGMSQTCQTRHFAPQKTTSLFDDLGRLSQCRWWDRQSQRLGGLHVDHQIGPVRVDDVLVTFGLPQLADIFSTHRHVSNVPGTDIPTPVPVVNPIGLTSEAESRNASVL